MRTKASGSRLARGQCRSKVSFRLFYTASTRATAGLPSPRAPTMLVLTCSPHQSLLDTLYRGSIALGQNAMDMQTDSPDRGRAGKRTAQTPSNMQRPAKSQQAELTGSQTEDALLQPTASEMEDAVNAEVEQYPGHTPHSGASPALAAMSLPSERVSPEVSTAQDEPSAQAAPDGAFFFLLMPCRREASDKDWQPQEDHVATSLRVNFQTLNQSFSETLAASAPRRTCLEFRPILEFS